MLKHKHQLFFLLIACYSLSTTIANAQTQSSAEYFGTADSGWDLGGTAAAPTGIANPNSDTSNQEAYTSTSNHSVVMPVNQPNYTDYTANAPGVQPRMSIYPGANSPTATGAPAGILSPVSQRNLTATNPNLKVDKMTGLPPTVLDSFVAESNYSDGIYGHEGGITPDTSGSWSVISSGFHGQTKKGLTTGHGSKLPSAWAGGMSVSGPSYASSPLNNALQAVEGSLGSAGPINH